MHSDDEFCSIDQFCSIEPNLLQKKHINNQKIREVRPSMVRFEIHKSL
jgi:hypothetical protein